MKEWKWLALVCLLMIPNTWAAQELSSTDCLDCHMDASLTKEMDGKQISVFVDPNSFEASVHGFLDCADCHATVKSYPHELSPQPVSCAECHSDEKDAYDQGLHAQARRRGDLAAASCLNCHGDSHAILAVNDPQSKVYRTNIPQTCGTCHSLKFVMERAGLSAQPFFSYEESVHGRAVAAGSVKAAVCTDCHRSHDVRSAADPQSSIFKFSVPQTCGQCHDSVTTKFNQSIHGQAIRRGNWKAPVCTDCHGIHLIKSHIDPSSSVAAQTMARTTCGQCHEGVRLSRDFGVAGQRVSTYLASYHGLATRLGSKVAANCASCHGIHSILPSSDPRSTISNGNLASTCGQCHPGASEKFIQGHVHVGVPISEDLGSIVTYWVRTTYLWLIVIVVGSMVMHNVLIWRRKVLEQRQNQDRPIVRMTPNQRFQHTALFITFLVLVLTGFALKYPDSWLVWLMGFDEAVRRVLHRISGAILIMLGLYHLGYALLTEEGRAMWKGLRPSKKDLTDLIGNLRYYLGRSSLPAQFGQFGYAEKVEYLALVWGVLIMAITGLMAWFEVKVTWLLPRWAIDVAMTIHFYEAVLATLAIVVWHFYHVIFDPDVYPMNWSWWDGRMSVEHFRKEHPLAYEERLHQQEKGQKEKLKTQPDEPGRGSGCEPSPGSPGGDNKGGNL